MTNETHLAFAHPEERAAALASGDPCDRISLRDHVVSADIGAFQQERGPRQRLRFNIAVELRPQDGPVLDDVDRILSYDRLTEAIAAALAEERLNLLETLAARVAERILREPQAQRVFLRVEKLDRGPGALGVEIVRSAPEAAPVMPGDAPRPIVAHLSNALGAAPDLAARLGRLAGQGAPVILTVDIPDLPRPVTGDAPSQQRIDLLAMEQNAWALAARDPRCTVVATRTELDWAMRQGQMVVWAPSKIVLDAVEGPGAGENGAALALWLAGQMDALRLELHGDHGSVSAPAGNRVPVVSCPD